MQSVGDFANDPVRCLGASAPVYEHQLQRLNAKEGRTLKGWRHPVTNSTRHDHYAYSILDQIECFLRRSRFLHNVRLEAGDCALVEQPLIQGRMRQISELVTIKG